MSKCKFEGCSNPPKGRDYCSGHMQQLYRGQELAPLQPKVRLRQPTPETKVCTECMTVKTLDEFYKHTHNGHFSKCKECIRAAQRARRAAKRAAEAQR